MMTYIAQFQTDDYLHEIATYFGAQQVLSRAGAHEVDRGGARAGRQLVTEGDRSLNIHACNSCTESCWAWLRRCGIVGYHRILNANWAPAHWRFGPRRPGLHESTR